ncbi:hypothetical protein KHA80_06370 [Anaerobacillus sp. HL2]|nr:hypothetical protein KHA80_06370 [Anaerobacillus sp. HL2]
MQKLNNETIISLYLDYSTEFAKEPGVNGLKLDEKLEKNVNQYIRQKLLILKKQQFELAAGGMVVSTLAFGAVGVLLLLVLRKVQLQHK